jgi:class I fructose-bisphosphate aldolase
MSDMNKVREMLGDEAGTLLDHVCKTIPKENLQLPGGDFIDRVWSQSTVIRVCCEPAVSVWPRAASRVPAIFRSCRLTRASSIRAGAVCAETRKYFDPDNIVKLAIEGGCNGVASTFGVLGSIARRYAHKIPFIVKINHNELLTYPNKFDQVMFGTVNRRMIWALSRSARRSILARTNLRGRSPRSPRHLPMHMSWEWRPSCGVICETRRSRRPKATCTTLRT